MKVWTVANQKGGVGKTTTTVSLGGLLAQQGKRVLMIDTDPHASLSYYFGIDAEATSHSVYDIFIQSNALSADNVMDCLCPTKLDNLYVLPATMALATLDRTMGSEQGMGLVLKKALAKIADEFDVAIIDCPPVLGVLIRTMEIMGRSLNKSFDTVIIPTMFDKRTNAALASRKRLIDDYGERVWEGVIPVDTHFRDASLVQLPISAAYPKTRGVSAYAKLLAVLEN